MGLFNTTPVYSGDGQPPSDDKSGGILGSVTGLFSFSSTPAYQTATTAPATTPAAPASSTSSTTATTPPAPDDDATACAAIPIVVLTACAAIPIVVLPDCNGQYPAAVVIERSK